jgi:protein SCO1/2
LGVLTASLLGAVPAQAQYAAGPQRPEAASQKPGLLKDVGIDQKIGARLPLDARFKNEDGDVVRLGDYFGDKPVLLVPAYYECPMLCTLVLNGVTSALRALSFDPRETPALARAKRETYLGEYRRPGAERGWHFLTGDEADIRRVTDAIGFRYHWDEASKQFAHASGIVVLTPRGRVSHYFYGVDFSPRDTRLALVEASDEQIGSVVDALLLFCFHYDPATGRYSKIALGAMRVGGVLTVAALVGFVVVMLRRERSQRMRHHPA